MEQHSGESALLLEDFVCHKRTGLKEAIEADGGMRIMIPPGDTYILQPCDVGINKPLKNRLKARAAKWRLETIAKPEPSRSMSTPIHKDVRIRLKQMWDEFTSEIVHSSFRGSGYVYVDEMYHIGET